jgi:hypothetical protein
MLQALGGDDPAREEEERGGGARGAGLGAPFYRVRGVGETTPKAVGELWRWSLVVEAFREKRGKAVLGVRYALMVAQWKGRGRTRGAGVAVVCGSHGGDRRLEVGERTDEWGPTVSE